MRARLRQHLEALSVFGRPAGGTFADGVSRVRVFRCRRRRTGLRDEADGRRGLKPRIDAAGNIFGRRAGSQDSLPPVLFGSHIDSVPNGGNFDGDLGFAGCDRSGADANEARVTTRRPLEVVVWQNEEGFAFNNGLVGSRAAAGHLDQGELDAVWNGMKKSDAIRKIGGAPERIARSAPCPGSFACYLELHIEQGGTLEKAKCGYRRGGRHRRHRPLRRGDSRLCQPRRHHADGGAARRTGGGIAPHDRGR